MIAAILGMVTKLFSISKVPAKDSAADVYIRDVIGKKDDTTAGTVGTNKSLMANIKGIIWSHTVPSAGSVDNARMRDVIGIKTDTAATVVNAVQSIMAYVKGIFTAVSNISSNQTVTVTEQEPCVAGNIAISAGTDIIPFSSLDNVFATIIGDELDNNIGGADSYMAVDWITEMVVVYAYTDATVTNHGTVTPMRYEADGTTTVGSNFIFSEFNPTENVDITRVGNGRFVVQFVDQPGNDDISVLAGQLDEVTLDITLGADRLAFDTVTSRWAAICEADNDKFCDCYGDETNSIGYLIAGSVNPSTLVITLGDKVSLDVGQITNVSICKIDTDVVGCAYKAIALDNDGYSTIATLSALVVTPGNEIEFEDGPVSDTGITSPDTTHIVIGYFQTTGDRIMEAIAASISGTVPTFGLAVSLSEGTDTVLGCQIESIDALTFMSTWDNTTDSKTGYSVSTLDGVVITPGEIHWFTNDIPPVNITGTGGKCLKKNSYNDIVYFGQAGGSTYGVMMDIGWKDGTYQLNDILGVCEDDVGMVIVEGIDEGNASGEDPALTYYYDSRFRCVRKKGHGNSFGYTPRVRVVAPDALKAIGG